MPTANEQLVSERIARQESHTDDALALAALLIALLDESEPQVRVIIERHLQLLQAPGVRLNSPAVQADMGRMREEITAVRTQAFDRVRDQLEDELRLYVSDEQDFFVDLYRRTHGLEVSRNTQAFEQMYDTPWLGRDFDTWINDLATSDANRLTDEVMVGVLQDQTRTRILKAVLGDEDLDGNNGESARTRSQLRNIVDTGLFALLGIAASDFADSNALILPRDLYVAVLDSRTTHICRSLHGKVFARGNGPYPPLHWHCRSIRVALPAAGDVPDVP